MNESPKNLGPETESKGSGTVVGPSVQLERILAPVDFSPASRAGLAFAASVARQFHSRIHLLHVVEPPVLPEWGYAHIPVRDARLRHAAEEQLPQLPLECGIEPGIIEASEVRNGGAVDEICKAAVATRTDLIVLASHGLGGIQHAVTGSTAERVVRRAPCPVLTVRDKALQKNTQADAAGFVLKRVLVTTDFSDESKKAFPYALAFARKFEAALILVYVVPAHLPAELSHLGHLLEERRLLTEARERMPRFRQAEFDPLLQVETLVLTGSPAHEICRTAETQGADLIVMATHGHTGLKHFVLGSVTENVVRHASCPVLAVRPQEHDFVQGHREALNPVA
jgi:nucleotide-binding universal stress UspA family protein